MSIHSADEDQLVGAWMKAQTRSSYPWIGLSTQTCSLGCSGNWAAEYSWSDGTATDYSNPVWVQNDNAPTYGHYYRNAVWGTWCRSCKSEGVCLKWTMPPSPSPPPLCPSSVVGGDSSVSCMQFCQGTGYVTGQTMPHSSGSACRCRKYEAQCASTAVMQLDRNGQKLCYYDVCTHA